MLFFLRLDDVRRRSNWPADPRTILCAPTLMESLLGECSLDFASLPGEPVYAGSTALSSPRVTRSCVFVCCPRLGANTITSTSLSKLTEPHRPSSRPSHTHGPRFPALPCEVSVVLVALGSPGYRGKSWVVRAPSSFLTSIS